MQNCRVLAVHIGLCKRVAQAFILFISAQGEPQPLNPKGKKSEVNQYMVVEFFWVVHYYEFSAEAASPFRLREGEKLAVP